jgi:hypothetical protein
MVKVDSGIAWTRRISGQIFDFADLAAYNPAPQP